VHRRRRALLAIGAIAAFGLLSSAQPQAQAETRAVERTARGPADKEIRIGVYINIRPDCSSGPLPSIRLTGPPTNGKVTVKSAKMKGTNYKQCLALEVPAYVAFYRSAPGFVGTDVVTLEVKFPGGRSETQKITVMIGGPGQSI
jgi:hypothetical protein